MVDFLPSKVSWRRLEHPYFAAGREPLQCLGCWSIIGFLIAGRGEMQEQHWEHWDSLCFAWFRMDSSFAHSCINTSPCTTPTLNKTQQIRWKCWKTDNFLPLSFAKAASAFQISRHNLRIHVPLEDLTRAAEK